MTGRVYMEEHSFLERDFLDEGHRVKEELVASGESSRLDSLLGYVRARIPKIYREDSIPMKVPRVVVKELLSYGDNSASVLSKGLGLTLLNSGITYSNQSLYVLATSLVDMGYSCFTITIDELVYYLKEAWSDSVLKRELDERFAVDFFFLLSIPRDSTNDGKVFQDLFGRLALRRTHSLPCILSADVYTGIKLVTDVHSDSFIGKLVDMFMEVNKPIIIHNQVSRGEMYKDMWGVLDGER